jgi:transcriptional regulator with XRE-family HTH domain
MTQNLSVLIQELRGGAGLSQRALASLAGTSQPAIARYESGAAVPAWETLQRLAAACGRYLRLDVEIAPDPEDIELAEGMLRLSPQERLQALSGYANLRELALAQR